MDRAKQTLTGINLLVQIASDATHADDAVSSELGTALVARLAACKSLGDVASLARLTRAPSCQVTAAQVQCLALTAVARLSQQAAVAEVFGRVRLAPALCRLVGHSPVGRGCAEATRLLVAGKLHEPAGANLSRRAWQVH